jgi:hypothetical protein
MYKVLFGGFRGTLDIGTFRTSILFLLLIFVSLLTFRRDSQAFHQCSNNEIFQGYFHINL